MLAFLWQLFETTVFAQHASGRESTQSGWIQVLSDVALWGAFLVLGCILFHLAYRRRDLPRSGLLLVLGACLVLGGLPHLMDAAGFGRQAYWLTSVVNLIAAGAAWVAVAALFPWLRKSLASVGPAELEREITERKRAEARLLSLQQQSEVRTQELQVANEALQAQTERLSRSEEQLRLALDAGRMGTWDWNVATGELIWTGKLEEIHGFEPGTFAGTFESFLSAVHPDDRAELSAQIQMAMDRHEPFEIIFRSPRADGSTHWIGGQGAAIYDQQGQPLRMVGVGYDVTARKHAEQSARFLAEASAALANLTDTESTLQKLTWLAVPEFADWCAVDLVSDDGLLRRVAVAHIDPEKAQLAREFHARFPPQPTDAHGSYQVVRSGKAEFLNQITDEMLEQGARGPEHLEAVRKLGLHSYMCVPLALRDEILGVMTFVSARISRRYTEVDVLLAEDLARRAAIAIENARLYGNLRAVDQRKDQFLAILAHELRNPLAPIGNGLQLMQLSTADRELREMTLTMMQRQFDHLVRLVDDLLDISRIRRGKIELRLEPTTLEAVIARAIESAQPLISAQRHALTVDLPEHPVPLTVDGVRISQVLTNLLANAAKYTDPGGKISLQATVTAEEVCLCVRDTGIGISPDLLPQVFDLFMQAEPGGARAQGGLGIGLMLVRNLIELHGGRVAANSRGVGEGSEFCVWLPLGAAAANNGKLSGKNTGEPSSPRRVLVVDDNVDAALTLTALLRARGHEVQLAYDGVTALELTTTHRPDLIILDLGMPGMSGLEVARRIRQSPGGAQIKLIALTGWGGPDDRRRTADAGFDAHLVKPVNFSELEAELGQTPASPHG